MAKQHNIYISVTLPYTDNSVSPKDLKRTFPVYTLNKQWFNSCLIFNRQGKLIGRHNKYET
eukprot:UN16852